MSFSSKDIENPLPIIQQTKKDNQMKAAFELKVFILLYTFNSEQIGKKSMPGIK